MERKGKGKIRLTVVDLWFKQLGGFTEIVMTMGEGFKVRLNQDICFVPFSSIKFICLFVYYLERGDKGGLETETLIFFYLFIHSSVASYVYPDRKLNT